MKIFPGLAFVLISSTAFAQSALRTGPAKKDDPAAGLDIELMAWLTDFEAKKLDRIEAAKKKHLPKSTIDRIAGEKASLPPVKFPFKDGDCGTAQSFERILVIQVIDPKNFLGEITEATNPFSITVQGRTYRQSGRVDRQRAWFSGFSTKGMTDNTLFDCPGMWRVSGTKQFSTADGATSTVIKIVPLDLAPYFAELRRRAIPDPADTDDSAALTRIKDNAEAIEKARKEEGHDLPIPKPRADQSTNEEKAAMALKMAESVKDGNKRAYERRLKEVIEKFPETKAAAKAKRSLP